MNKLSNQPWFRKYLITLAGKGLLNKFIKSSKKTKHSQNSLLSEIIATSKNTLFGKDHSFDKIKSIQDYRKAVPLGNFERHRPYVDKMCQGERDILFPGKPLFYNTTSGTTAKPKLIPVSKTYFEKAYSGISRLWLYSCVLDNPHIYDGKSLAAVAAAEEGRVADGTPYGSISGVAFKNVPKILQSTYCTPYPIIAMSDYEKKYYALLRCALPENITIIVSPSPSNLLQFHTTVLKHFSELVKDIHDGTFNKNILSTLAKKDQETVLSYFNPNPIQAQLLESLMSTYGSDLRPKHYWPNLAMVNTWKQGNFALLIPKLQGYYPKTTVIREFGYQASEGRAGLVLGNDWDYSVLACNLYHFEFIEEQARFQKDPPMLEAHELEIGKRYFIFFSNGSGLYRYDINDIIEVTGFFNQTPLFRFIQKGEGVTSLTGEKLTEEQVIQAVGEVEGEPNSVIAFYILFCDEQTLGYRFFVEFTPGITDSTKKLFCSSFDNKLKKLNPEYKVKRESKRLSPPQLQEMKKNSYNRLKHALLSKGMAREGQYKDVYLTQKKEILPILTSLEN